VFCGCHLDAQVDEAASRRRQVSARDIQESLRPDEGS
jgi:hypothetical protein